MKRKREKKPDIRWLESADLMSTGEVTLTIKAVSPPGTEKSDDGEEMPMVVWFEGTEKGFVVGCKTNQRNLNAQLTPKASTWPGKKVTLTVRYLREAFGEKNVPAIRVLMPPGKKLPMQSRPFMGKETPFAEEES